jgi:hypothetical protein
MSITLNIFKTKPKYYFSTGLNLRDLTSTIAIQVGLSVIALRNNQFFHNLSHDSVKDQQ